MTTPNASLIAHSRLNIVANSVRKEFQNGTCKQLELEPKKLTKSAICTLYEPRTKSFYQTFCDFTSESGFVWTLLESFSLTNNNEFKGKTFLEDFQENQRSFTWNKFRLSRLMTNTTLNHSLYVRATCTDN